MHLVSAETLHKGFSKTHDEVEIGSTRSDVQSIADNGRQSTYLLRSAHNRLIPHPPQHITLVGEDEKPELFSALLCRAVHRTFTQRKHASLALYFCYSLIALSSYIDDLRATCLCYRPTGTTGVLPCLWTRLIHSFGKDILMLLVGASPFLCNPYMEQQK